MDAQRREDLPCSARACRVLTDMIKRSGAVVRPWRVAIAGTGGIAGRHVDALRQQGRRGDFVAVVGRDHKRARAFADGYGIGSSYINLEEMLSDAHPNLVLLCTPPAVHFSQVLSCLLANAWVLCEKPICGSLAELDDIALAERASEARVCERVPVAIWSTRVAAETIDAGGRARPSSSCHLFDHLVPLS